MNLGSFSKPLLVFGGPYSNLQASQAIKAEAERLGIPPEQCLCTGDIVAYCAQASETTDFLRDWGVHCLMGNCEESFAQNADDCGCGFDEGTSCDLLSAQWFTHANQQLSSEQREWFASLPQEITLQLDEVSTRLVHGSVSSINQFIFASSEDDVFQKELNLCDEQLIIAGHSGIPFTKTIGGRTWHNAGAIGMPANDGTPRTWFSIINIENQQPVIQIRALDYDYKTTYREMEKAGMNNGYATALRNGLWPSVDVLPKKEREKRGIALSF